MTATPLLELSDVTVDFDGFVALDDVTFTLEPGELRFVIGPNGAGKTTLIDVITGLVRPTTGTVTFGGDDITAVRDLKRVGLGIGRSFQTPTVFDALTVVENLDLAATHDVATVRLFRRRRGLSDEVTAALERVGLVELADRRAGTLSHGQRRWLEIGMLLVQGPRLLLLDEPVAGMSTDERHLLGDLIVELTADHTILVVEHDMAFLRRYARRVTVLHEGAVLREGTVDEVQGDAMVKEIYLGRSRDERTGAADLVPADDTEPDPRPGGDGELREGEEVAGR